VKKSGFSEAVSLIAKGGASGESKLDNIVELGQ